MIIVVVWLEIGHFSFILFNIIFFCSKSKKKLRDERENGVVFFFVLFFG